MRPGKNQGLPGVKLQDVQMEYIKLPGDIFGNLKRYSHKIQGSRQTQYDSRRNRSRMSKVKRRMGQRFLIDTNILA
jgi:hypothetical protein